MKQQTMYVSVCIAIVAVILGGLWWYQQSLPTPATTSGTISDAPAVRALDWKNGPATSTVTLIEYSDFQCPACASYYPVVEQVRNELGDKFLFVYRHFPLSEIHPNALPAAYASEAAGKQGKFWEMYGKLFSEQNVWATLSDPRDVFAGYAQTLGLDVEQFKKDSASNEIRTKVANSRNEALDLGLPGTPSFFLNGKSIESPRSVEAFRTLITDALASSTAAVGSSSATATAASDSTASSSATY